MTALRAFTGNHPQLALLMVALAFFVKALVPAGFMVSASPSTVLTIAMCSPASGNGAAVAIAIPDKDNGPAKSDTERQTHCAFAGLGKLALGAADAALLASAVAFILAIGFAPYSGATIARTRYLQPPLRGPPATS